MPGQTWEGAASSFLGKWVVMMAAMMLPSLVPALRRYREAIGGAGAAHVGSLTMLAGAGYFFVWAVVGVAVFALCEAVAATERQLPALAEAIPAAAGAVVLIAGTIQFSRWKAHHLACCRGAEAHRHGLAADAAAAWRAATAWRYGLGLGRHCCYCCANLTAILLVFGLMDLRAMAAVTAAITLERLAPAGERIARATGAVAVGGGLLLIVRAAGLA